MSKSILIVDDEVDVTESVKMALEHMAPNFKVSAVNSGEECIAYLEKKIPDLILLDIMMPGMSGWDVFHKLRETNKWSRIPVIFLTALPDRGAREAEKYKIEDYIQKPIELNDLKDRIEFVLKKAEEEKDKEEK